MNAFIRKAVSGALISVGAIGAQAAALGTGSNVPGTTSLTFTMSVTSGAQFGVFLTDGLMQFAPDSVALYAGASVIPMATSSTPISLPGGTLLSFASLQSGQSYTLEFDTTMSTGTFNVVTSLASSSFSTPVVSSPVPEASSLALAFAGLGVLGLLGRRKLAA